MAADIAVHAPGQEGDSRNHHAHILTTTREIGPDGLGAKTRTLDERRSGAMEEVRAQWAKTVNAALERAKVAERVDHRSHARRGIEEAPGVHLGQAAAAMERRGVETDRGGINRFALSANRALRTARQAMEHIGDRAKETVDKVMDRSARIMAELAQMDMGKLDEALQIRQAERILQERAQEREETKEKNAGRDFGMEM